MSLLDVWVLFLVLGTLAVFAAGVWVLVRLARNHADDDPRGMSKVAIAIVLSLVLGAGGLVALGHFEATGRVGIHNTFASALNRTLGEGDYLDAGKTIAKRQETIAKILLPKLAEINATLDAYFTAHPGENATSKDLPPYIAQNLTLQKEKLAALAGAQKDLEDAIVKQRTLTPNHAVWLQVQPLVAAGRDDEAEPIVLKAINVTHVTEVLPLNGETAAANTAPCERDARTGLCTMPLKAKALEHSFFDAHLVANVPVSAGGPEAFEHQREFNHQMAVQLRVFGYSMVTGFMMAPFVFAGGAILRRAFVPSDTVGFKPYPSKAAGLFLLLGAFGVFAIPFSAWTLRDLHKRSVEGQIAL